MEQILKQIQDLLNEASGTLSLEAYRELCNEVQTDCETRVEALGEDET